MNGENNTMLQKDNYFFSKTFCILPWIHTFVDVNGKVKLCCIATEWLNEQNPNTDLNLQNQSLHEIWNSPQIKDSRRKMIAGEKVEACSRCDRAKKLGQTSTREIHILKWLSGDGRESKKWLKRVQDSIEKDFIVTDLPVYYDIRPGNTCTLKCRMCHADYSNLIQNDPVHSQWAYQCPEIEGPRFSDGQKWYNENSSFMEELLKGVDETRAFYFAGGEPLINPFVKKVIDNLIERKVAHKIELEFSSNLTVFSEELFEKLNNFDSVKLFISVDGVGQVYEYIRYPGKWKIIEHNLKKIIRIPTFSSHITTTVQNYNALSITDLLTFAESLDIPVTLNMVYIPDFLNVSVMPKKARLLAAARLKEYADKSQIVEKDTGMKLTINNVLLELEQENYKFYHKKIEDFMIFTNALDKSRNQSFKDTFPELYHLIKEDGIIWNKETNRKSVVPTKLAINEITNEKNITLETLLSTLKLGAHKSKNIEDILNSAKDEFAEICLRSPLDNSESPVEYAANLQMKTGEQREGGFYEKFISYILEKKEPVSGCPYLEVAQKIENKILIEINTILSNDEKNILRDMNIGSLIFLDTGYDPLQAQLIKMVKKFSYQY